MQPAPIPAEEDERLKALRHYEILDTAPEFAFDRLCKLGARVFQVPIVLITLVDQNRQWFKACYGFSATETGRNVSFCAHAILTDAPLIIPDARADLRFCDNPLVTGEPHIRFYAGAPLITIDGSRIGTFCLIDQAARPQFTPEYAEMLSDFAALVVEELELRRTARALAQTERALRTSEQRFNAFMDHSPALAFMKDLNGRLVYVNNACKKMWNRSVSDLVGKYDSEIWPAEVAERIQKTDMEVLRDSSAVTVIEEAPISESMHRFLTFKFPFKDDAGTAFLGAMAVDITDRLRLEDELREQTKRADEASRLKSEFLANMSHELRTPLNGIIGFSELLADGKGGTLNPRQQRFIDNIVLSSRHLLRLINDLLDLAKIEAGKLELCPEAASARDLVMQVTNSMQALADSKFVTLSVEVDPNADRLFIDPARFKQVVYNYVSNAIKFSRDQGSVKVHVSRNSLNEVRVDVSDTGIGIEPEDVPRLFQQFQQLDSGASKRYQGTGLGLALVKKLVKRHSGRVEVRSDVGRGSVFSAFFPRVLADNEI